MSMAILASKPYVITTERLLLHRCFVFGAGPRERARRTHRAPRIPSNSGNDRRHGCRDRRIAIPVIAIVFFVAYYVIHSCAIFAEWFIFAAFTRRRVALPRCCPVAFCCVLLLLALSPLFALALP